MLITYIFYPTSPPPNLYILIVSHCSFLRFPASYSLQYLYCFTEQTLPETHKKGYVEYKCHESMKIIKFAIILLTYLSYKQEWDLLGNFNACIFIPSLSCYFFPLLLLPSTYVESSLLLPCSFSFN